MITTEQLNEWQALCDTQHPGPWRWEVNRKRKIVELVSMPNPVFTVMAFSRFGMSGAQPEFSVRSEDGIHAMRTKASDAAVPSPGREHHRDWFMAVDHPTADFIATSRTAMPQLIAEVRRLREELRTCQANELKRLMTQWSSDWFGDPQDLAPDIIWHAWPDESYPGRELDSMAIVEFGRRIDAWITDDGEVVTIAEWEKMVKEKEDK